VEGRFRRRRLDLADHRQSGFFLPNRFDPAKVFVPEPVENGCLVANVQPQNVSQMPGLVGAKHDAAVRDVLGW
jgi:hypothetical protein